MHAHHIGEKMGAMKDKWPNNLKKIMDEQHVSAATLVRKSGISKQNISRWVRGERQLFKRHALRLAPILGVPPEKLEYLEDELEPTINNLILKLSEFAGRASPNEKKRLEKAILQAIKVA